LAASPALASPVLELAPALLDLARAAAERAADEAARQVELAERAAERAELLSLREHAAEHARTLDALRADAEQRGYRAGEERGELAAASLQQAQVDRLKALAFQLSQARDGVLADAEDMLVEIAFAAVCRIVGEQGARRDTLLRVVAEASATARQRDQLTIRLHPDDAALLRLGAHGPEPLVRFVGDASVQLGGCMVDSAAGTLDARFETQLSMLGAAFAAVRADRVGEQESI
jgi:flagellar assembly protein FliH